MKKIDYKNIAKDVINLEIKALQKLKKSLNQNFNRAVNAIVNCQSKVILCGVGKSGIIANKISATLSSIGTPSFSLSANDCSHGDMGSISRKDILVLISYSGNSIELRNIINYANRNKILLIGITSKINSELYKNSDIGVPSKLFFKDEVNKYAFMWKDGGEFSTDKYVSENFKKN